MFDMKKKKNKTNKVSDAEIREFVVERLKTLPSGKRISIGAQGSLTKDELIKRVEFGDELGRKIVAVELEFLQALKKGEFIDEQTPSCN